MTIMTGYFGIPGRARGQVHVVRDGKPLCGRRIHSKAEFLWCARGIVLEYVECERCRERAARLLNQDEAAPVPQGAEVFGPAKRRTDPIG